MKKTLLIAVTLAVAAVAGVGAGLSERTTELPAETVESTTAAPGGYVLRDCNGRIAVYARGKETPYEIFNIYTDSLPPADAEALRDGIVIETTEELNKKLEEFTS